MDYGAQNQQNKADAAAATQTPATPPAPEVPADPANTAAVDDDQIVLDDLFPAESKPAADGTPPAQAAPAAPATPATPTDDEKAKAELEQRFTESQEKLNKTLNNTVDQL